MATGLDTFAKVSGIQLAATALAAAREALTPAPPPREKAAKVVLQVALDRELMNAFGPPLKDLGFDLQTRELPNPVNKASPNKRSISTAIGSELQFYFVLLPPWLLDDGDDDENISAFAFLGQTFSNNAIVYILSPGLRDMDLPFLTMAESWRQDRSIRITFVSWRIVSRLLKLTDRDAQTALVQQSLKLDEIRKEARQQSVPDATLPSREEKEFIIELLTRNASSPMKTLSEYFSALVLRAELPNPTLFHWDQGDADDSARKLVKYVTETSWLFPLNHEYRGQPILGRLLKAITMEKLSPDDHEKLVKIILDHGLIRDPKVLQELRVSIQPQK
jgi:hypothetical protein